MSDAAFRRGYEWSRPVPGHGRDVCGRAFGGEATVKTLTHRGMTLVLEPANEGERSIEVGPRDDFGVLGVVTGIFRPFFDQPAAAAAVEEAITTDHTIGNGLPSLPTSSVATPVACGHCCASPEWRRAGVRRHSRFSAFAMHARSFRSRCASPHGGTRPRSRPVGVIEMSLAGSLFAKG